MNTKVVNNFKSSSETEFIAKFITYSRNQSSTAIWLIALLGLSACGGGGGGALPATPTQPLNPTDPATPTNPGGAEDDVTDNTVVGGAVGGGGGGAVGGGGGGAVPNANNLILTRSGSDYTTSSLAGFTLLGTDSHYQVADKSDDQYSVALSASGNGMLTFEFADADDVITLESGSTVSGFSQLKVMRGTIDASTADLGSITTVSVASSVKLSTEQVLDLDAIIINSASGGVEVVVSSQADIDLISSALSSGSINLYSPATDLMTLAPAVVNSLTNDQINSGNASINTEIQAISAIDDAAVISIRGANNGLVGNEISSAVRVNIFPDTGITVVSGRIDGIDVGAIASNSFSFNGSSMSSGFHTVSVITQDSSGVQATTQEEFLLVGSSNDGSEMFEFRSSQQGDLINVDIFVKNLHTDFSDGIRSYDFFIDLDESKFDYVEGSFQVASGSTNAGAENQSNGEIFANGFFSSPWSNYEDPIFSFQANSLTSANSMDLSFVDLTIYRTELGDFTNTIDV